MAWESFGHRGKGGRNIDYRNTDTGEILSYHQYLKQHKYGGFDSHAFAKLRKDGRGLRLIEAYKNKQGSYAGLRLQIEQLRQSKPGRERRLALISFYPNAAYAPDDRYMDSDDDRFLNEDSAII